MNILVEIGHPAHVHLFKNLIYGLKKKGHEIKIVASKKEISLTLLDRLGMDFMLLGVNKTGLIKKVLSLVKKEFKFFKICNEFKPNLLISRGSLYSAIMSKLTGIHHISLSDTEHVAVDKIVTHPFSNYIITPYCYKNDFGKRQIRINTFQELAYLHPNYYQPNVNILRDLNLKEGERFFVLRFIAWTASHDIGNKGITVQDKREIIHLLEKYGRVFISSERKLPWDFEKFRLKIPPEKIHDVLSFATLYIGEGATMASECAMLGTPAIYVNSLTAGTLEEQEKYGLIYGFRNSDGVKEKIIELLSTANLKTKIEELCQKMIAEKIDFTAFMVWFVDNYPESARIIKKNPAYQYSFIGI